MTGIRRNKKAEYKLRLLKYLMLITAFRPAVAGGRQAIRAE